MGSAEGEGYRERWERFRKAVALQRADRVCVAPLTVHYYFTRNAGISCREAMIDHERTFETWKRGVADLDLDLAPPALPLPSAGQWEVMGIKQFKWPGDGLGEDVAFQFVEDQYLRQEEYDEFLTDPGDFTVRKLWPRLSRALDPWPCCPPFTGSPAGPRSSCTWAPSAPWPPSSISSRGSSNSEGSPRSTSPPCGTTPRPSGRWAFPFPTRRSPWPPSTTFPTSCAA